jgi:hypothetical protein
MQRHSGNEYDTFLQEHEWGLQPQHPVVSRQGLDSELLERQESWDESELSMAQPFLPQTKQSLDDELMELRSH